MSGLTHLYGHRGLAAGGDPTVAELLSRTVDGQYRTTQAFESSVARMQVSGSTPWSATLPSMVVMHAQWLASMLWQTATGYLDAAVLENEAREALPKKVHEECDSLCDLAGRATMEAVRLQSEIDHGVDPVLTSLVELSSLQITGESCSGAWAVFEAIYLQVVTDFRLIKSFDASVGMRPVKQTLESSLPPMVEMFEYLSSGWSTTKTEESRIQLLREALPVATKIFTIGQQLWAPYHLGQVYKKALQFKPSLEELGLGFDPWCLTDPDIKKTRINDKVAKDQLVKFWESVADPAITYRLNEQVKAAVMSDRVRLRTGHGYSNVAPWPSQYLVRFPIQFGDRSFSAGDLVAFYGAEGASGKYEIEVRRTGRAQNILVMLGQD